MKLLNYLLQTQPYIVKQLEMIGFKSFQIQEEEDDPEFEYFDKLMRQTPKP